MQPDHSHSGDRPGDPRHWPVDLHAHTTSSDGTLEPAALVALAAERDLRVLAITDHDTIDGIVPARTAATGTGISIVPGVELSTTERGVEVHVLGYGVDPHDSSLVAALGDLAAGRVRRIAAMIDRLHDAGFAIDGDAILAQAETGSVGRPHVARALIAIGAASSIDDAFARFLTPGRPGWVPRDPFSPEEAVDLLVHHHALPVLAHPFSAGKVEPMLGRLVPHGLKGMEVWYGEYDDAQRAQLQRIADEHDLIPTGGSDYHGPGFRAGRDLGTAPVPLAVFERLVAAGVRI